MNHVIPTSQKNCASNLKQYNIFKHAYREETIWNRSSSPKSTQAPPYNQAVTNMKIIFFFVLFIFYKGPITELQVTTPIPKIIYSDNILLLPNIRMRWYCHQSDTLFTDTYYWSITTEHNFLQRYSRMMVLPIFSPDIPTHTFVIRNISMRFFSEMFTHAGTVESLKPHPYSCHAPLQHLNNILFLTNARTWWYCA